MPRAKRKKSKAYSYYEYVQKFRPKALPKHDPQLAEEPLDSLSKLALDKLREQIETHPTSDPRQ